MLRCSLLVCVSLIGCGGAASPAASPPTAKAPPAEAASAPAAAGPKAPPPDRDFQEALRCDEECESTEEGDYDTVEALCRERCGLPPRE